MTHFIDEQGNIHKHIPKEGRELANFLVSAVDGTTKSISLTLTSTEIRYFNKGCLGLIKTSVSRANAEIHCYCPVCGNEGVISNWGKTKWDNNISSKL
jgi:hypothetical protein